VLRFPAKMHATVAAIGPRRHLRAPLYHADLLLNDLAAREAKITRYEAGRPGFVIDGMSLNEVYYLPERRADTCTAPVPAQDRPLVDALLAPPPLPAAAGGGPRGEVERFSLAELVSRSEHRELGDADHRGRVELLDDDLRLVAGEWRTFDVEVSNLGATHWPGGMEAHPQIRVAYRSVGSDGTLAEGMRSPIGAVLRPGASAIVPLAVIGPDAPGIHEIEIDLVHEHVRWFGCAVRARIEVRAPAGPACGELAAP